MSLEKVIGARDFVDIAGMSARPEFYSGRGAISCDLNSKILEKIYINIQAYKGKDAAAQYVQMVADIPKLSATDFLLTLYRLENNDWKWDTCLLGNENGIDVGPDRGDGTRGAATFASLIGVMSGMSERDETQRIRGEFLMNHRVNEKKNKTSYADDN